MKKKTKHNFKVLKGGNTSSEESTYKFINSFVTNTRLMGVEVLYIHWQEESQDQEHFHQFFYFDGEEYGLDNYISYKGSDPSRVKKIETLLAGGLGGDKIQISHKEAVFLLQDYIRASKRLEVKLPDKHKEFDFLLETEVFLSPNERKELYEKECTPLENQYQAIHYFLMRIFSRDFEVASCLSQLQVNDLDLYPELKPSTLIKNTIEVIQNEYLCESLLDCNGRYYMAVSEISVKDNIIMSFEKHKLFQITPYEASLLINRVEYITCYDIFDDDIQETANLYPNSYMTLYDKGKLFMVYNSHNDHVKDPVFKIHEDVYGSYFISDYGQILLSSFVRDNLTQMEKTLSFKEMSRDLVTLGRFEFKEPILYEFIQDDIDDFIDFIEFYKE